MAAANFQPPTILCLFILLSISDIPQSSSQSNSPQNIQTYYPFSPPPPQVVLPPPPPVNDPPNILPPTTITPPTPPRTSSTKAAVGKAIGVTAASTIVVSALLFFLLLRHSRRKKEEFAATAAANGGTNHVAPQNDNFTPFNGNVKGLIVDENGLDVLYWRNLEEGEKSSFKRENYKSLKDERKEEDKRMVSDRERRNKPPVQEVPLLRGKSSTSQSSVWVEKDQMMEKAPSLSNGMTFKIEKQVSSIQLTPLPPPPPQPRLSVEAVPAPPPPPQPRMAVEAVPKEKMVAPPPPPLPLSNKGPAPPPPPPPRAGAPASSLKPPPPTRAPSERSSSLGESSQMKLKPLHWDKVNPNVEHSMVWDKIDKGSFK